MNATVKAHCVVAVLAALWAAVGFSVAIINAQWVKETPAQGYAPIILSIKPETPDTAQICAAKVGALASCRSVKEVREFLDRREK